MTIFRFHTDTYLRSRSVLSRTYYGAWTSSEVITFWPARSSKLALTIDPSLIPPGNWTVGGIVSCVPSASVTVNPAAVSASHSTVAAAPGTITASSGSSASTITVTAKDQFDNLIQGATVVLAANPTTGNNLIGPAGTTNASGVATGTLSSTKAESKTVSATINGVPITQTASVTVNPAAVNAGQSTVAAAPGTITASNGSSASTITVTAKDQFGNPIQGATVVLAANPTTGNTLTGPAGTTNSSGAATGTLSVATNCWVYPYCDTANGGAPLLRAGAVVIAPGGGFNADYKGFAKGKGPGIVNVIYDGGSYGGRGLRILGEQFLDGDVPRFEAVCYHYFPACHTLEHLDF